MTLFRISHCFSILTILLVGLVENRSVCKALNQGINTSRTFRNRNRRHGSCPPRHSSLLLLSCLQRPVRGDTRLFATETADSPIIIPVLLETDHVLVVNKPVGIPHHSTEDELGILNLLRLQQQQGTIEYTGRLYGVHRLDRVTSGILVMAKNAETARYLSKAFRDGRVYKYYTGISRHKATAKKQGWIQGNMIRGRRKSWQLTRESSDSSTPTNYAKTRFFTAGLGGLGHHLANEQVQPKTLLLFRPLSGRTHQLRVAAKSVGLPLAGDPTYSDGFSSTESVQRTYLHATGFYLPAADGMEAITVWSTPAFHHLWNEAGREEFQTILDTLVRKQCDCEALLDVLTL